MPQRLYRIEVDTWPTADGRPWARYYNAPGHARAHDDPDEEWPEFVARVVEAEQLPLPHRHRHTTHDPFAVTGFVCPQVTRRHYLSRTAAQSWVDGARVLGATCWVVASDPVTWPGERQR